MSDGKILLVDDEPQILTLVSRFLERSGYDVQTAAGGAMALERLRSTPFALVLSDLKMPNVDGLDILEEVRARYPDTIFILMTAFGTIDSAVSVLRQGAYDYLTKPLDLEDLRSTIARGLEHRQVVMQNKRLLEFLQEKNVVLEYLHNEERRKSEKLDQVNAIAREITAILDMETLVDTVIYLVSFAFDFEFLSFGIIESERLFFRGGQLEGYRERVEQTLFWELTGKGREPFVRSQSDRTKVQAPYDLIFPLQSRDRVIGFWVADWKNRAEYRQENLPYLEALAAQTVTALENARLYALARRADELAFLNEIGRAANQSLDLEQTIKSVLQSVRATFGATLAEVTLWDEDQHIQHVFTLVRGSFRASPQPLFGDEFVRRVRQDSLMIYGEADTGQLYPVDTAEIPLRSLLGVALFFGERQVGGLGVGSTNPGVYDREDAHLLQIVGAHVSTAIQNAQLFAEVVQGRQTILQSRNTLQALFDGILEGIYIVDQNNEVLAINRTQAGWAKRDVQELVGQSAWLAFPQSASSLELIAETQRTGEPASCTDRQRGEDGRWTEWEIQTYPVTGAEGGFARSLASAAQEPLSVDQVVVVVEDVTERRWLESSLARSEKLASIGQLAAGLAHEINNPMTVISANAQILREDIAPEHPYYGSVRLIDRASERASRIVRNLLDFSRVEQFEFVQTDLNLSLRDAVSLVEPQVRRANIDITLDLVPDLPRIWASPDHLHVVWLNLLLNARDAVQEAEREGWIRISSYQRDDRFVVRVADNGVGIPVDEINRIYDPFFTTKPPGKGTGLGLFTCYRTVQRHGGEISVDSQVGIGTSFDVALPIGQASAQD
jgi:signal transduction histidine kinase/DNA-binding response OmpR family regulator/GAF domain-containing protein